MRNCKIEVAICLLVWILGMLLGWNIAIHSAQSRGSLSVKVLERYSKDTELLLRDYRIGNLSVEDTIEVLLWDRYENGGMFVKLSETDHRIDKFFVSRAEHIKGQLYQRGLKLIK